jgi:DNA-directed RNA polymerase specialized sigma24 family protein
MTSDAPLQPITDEEYRRLRASLVRTFRASGLPDPDDLADEVVQRLLANIAGGETVRSLMAYAGTIAYNVTREEIRRLSRQRGLLSIDRTQGTPRDSDAPARCLARCMEQLDPADRKLLQDYYSLDGRERIRRHRALAQELGLTAGALTVKVWRLRKRLEACISECRKSSS